MQSHKCFYQKDLFHSNEPNTTMFISEQASSNHIQVNISSKNNVFCYFRKIFDFNAWCYMRETKWY